MNYTRMLLIVLLSASLKPVYAKNKLATFKQNLPSFSSVFDRNKETKVVEKEYALGELPRVIIENTLNGTVEVQTQENLDTIMVIITFKTKKEELLDLITYAENIEGDILTLTTIVDDETVKGSVHYQLIVPALTTVTVKNTNGAVTIQDAQGKVCVHTINGNVEFNNCSNTTVARIDSKGNINSNDASGHIKAYTKKGKICITNSSKSVIAKTEQGAITMTAQRVPSRSKINLSSSYGTITLALPENVNADLLAKSERGTVICQHEITLKPRTTTLTSTDWKELRRSVDGTIGSGTSEIRVNSNKNIAITYLT